ncbi:MAG TPA: filamentous hemagglutinin N-terminal domain-containing protein [Thiotrichaceae bacterium]|nr:filamentous hemagglutinin N-terminal domain-containing protein [Thiotrichaceae bacterium]
MYHHTPFFIFLFFQPLLTCHAEITFDGSLGPAMALPGPTYLIDADKGTLKGLNLFHSFQTFNINTGETATFTGPESIANIIGRVTGGKVSYLDGTLQSTIPNADLYLLNPNGFLLGNNAHLNIAGSLYLSSADSLRFADGQLFETQASTSPRLSVAAPTAFGFLDNPVGNITINGRVRVAENETLALIGGKIQLAGSDLYAPKGDINILSAASSGEVMRTKMMNNTLNQFGKVTIEQGSFLDVNAQTGKAGAVIIRSEALLMQDSHIQAMGETGTGNIDMLTTQGLHLTENSSIHNRTVQGQGGETILRGQQIDIATGSFVLSATDGTGQGGNLRIEAQETLTLKDDNSLIMTVTNHAGKGGDIQLRANTIDLQTGTLVTTESWGNAQAGDLHIQANTLSLHQSEISSRSYQSGGTGKIQLNIDGALQIEKGLIQAITFNQGDANKIELDVGNLILANGAQINASTEGTGKGGDIEIQITKTAEITGFSYLVDPETNQITNQMNPSGIASSTFDLGDAGTVRISAHSIHLDNWGTIQTLTQDEGNAGDMQIIVHDLQMKGGSDIDASNEGTGSGKGGNITINATGSVFITGQMVDDDTIGQVKPIVKEGYLGGIYSIAENTGSGGDVILSTPELIVRDGGVISVGSTSTGNAGDMNLSIGNTLKMNNAAIITQATQAGGGNIHIETPTQLHLIKSMITAQGDEIQDSGGNLRISQAGLIILGHSQILTTGFAGDGGQISIMADQFIKSSDSVLNASSTLGVDGDIVIEAPDVDLSGALIGLSSHFVEASGLADCANSRDEMSRFQIKRGKVLRPPDDLKGAVDYKPVP